MTPELFVVAGLAGGSLLGVYLRALSFFARSAGGR